MPIVGDLFGDGPPKLEDIRQSHQRANCYMSTAIATTLIRDGGWKKIEDIMQDNGDTVTVRLRGADVTVPKTQIITDEGDGIFNIGKPWVHILEKAITAYLLKDPDSTVTEADWGKVKTVIDQLAHTLGGPNEPAGDLGQLENHLDRGQDMTHTTWRGDWPKLIEDSLEQGKIVSFSVSSTSDHSLRMQQRIVPGHEYPIIGTATRNGKNGWLVMDVHGISAGWDGTQPGSFPQVSANDGTAITFDSARRGSGPIFFVHEDEADLFDHLIHES